MEKQLIHRILSIQNDSHSNSIGLFTGDMGVCLALYLIGSKYNSKLTLTEADKLLTHVTNNINKIKNTGFENGLAGIGWAICILHKHSCTDGEIDDILFNIDALIYKDINQIGHKVGVDLPNGLSGYLAYTVARLDVSELDSSSIHHKILVKLLKTIIDYIFQYTSELMDTLAKDVKISALHDFIILLFVLGKAHSLNLYSSKIKNIVKYWCNCLQCISPFFETNKFALAIGLLNINKELKDDAVNTLSERILSDICIDKFGEEFNLQALQTENGRIYSIFLLHSLKKLYPTNHHFVERYEELTNKMSKICSNQLQALLQDHPNLSFINGLSGWTVLYALYPEIFENFHITHNNIDLEYYYGKRSHLRFHED